MIQRTLALIKTDGLQRSLVGEILSRFEKVGLKIIGMKMIQANKDLATKHYCDIKEKHGERVFESLINYLTGSPVIAICFEGVDSINVVRKMVGSTYPNEALPGTIRGDFAHISKHYANGNKVKVSNLVHASASLEEAKSEVDLWFSNEELHEYKITSEVHLR
ncbi:nucleoside-diphosphate kinase [archaeon]|nr:nucleoside-diphosphate kinase [archaeon]|tara:strand:+ start:2629 stop:3117 length:489 start_codon:yes stop_codon:yes gene_type:complete